MKAEDEPLASKSALSENGDEAVQLLSSSTALRTHALISMARMRLAHGSARMPRMRRSPVLQEKATTAQTLQCPGLGKSMCSARVEQVQPHMADGTERFSTLH